MRERSSRFYKGHSNKEEDLRVQAFSAKSHDAVSLLDESRNSQAPQKRKTLEATAYKDLQIVNKKK